MTAETANTKKRRPGRANAAEASDDGPPSRLARSPVARVPLAAAAAGYSLVVVARNALYDRGIFRSRSVPARVVSIGNVVAGGTGKTPVVAELARRARERGWRVAIVSRGYGRRSGEELNDEGRWLRNRLGDVPIIENPDRVQGALRAIALGANLVLLDDGLQHRRLRRDADVVLVDATRPFEDERLLPLGFLREPQGGALRRATVVVLTRSELLPPDRLDRLRGAVRRLAPSAPVAVAETVVAGVSRLAGTGPPSGPAYLFAGIGNPAAFRRTAAAFGIEIAGFRALRDHHPYDSADVERLFAEARAAGASRLLTTEKDAVKLGSLLPSAGPAVDVLAIGVRFTAGESAVGEALLGRV